MGDLMRLDKNQRYHSINSARDRDRKYCPGGRCDYAEDRVHEDRYGKYVEDDASNYPRSRREIYRALDNKRGYRDGYKGYSSDYADDFEYSRRGRYSRYGDYDDHGYSSHLTEEEWLLKQKKEKKNLEELSQKEKELEAASREVNQAQDLLAQEK